MSAMTGGGEPVYWYRTFMAAGLTGLMALSAWLASSTVANSQQAAVTRVQMTDVQDTMHQIKSTVDVLPERLTRVEIQVSTNTNRIDRLEGHR